MLLANCLDDDDGDEEAMTRAATKVSVDLGVSAAANAEAYYEARRKVGGGGRGLVREVSALCRRGIWLH